MGQRGVAWQVSGSQAVHACDWFTAVIHAGRKGEWGRRVWHGMCKVHGGDPCMQQIHGECRGVWHGRCHVHGLSMHASDSRGMHAGRRGEWGGGVWHGRYQVHGQSMHTAYSRREYMLAGGVRGGQSGVAWQV